MAIHTPTDPVDVTRVRWSSEDPADRVVVHDPATGSELAVICGSGISQVDAAVRTAHSAHENWRDRPPNERGLYLRKAADIVRKHAEEIARLESSDNGKPLGQARGDVAGGRHYWISSAVYAMYSLAVREILVGSWSSAFWSPLVLWPELFRSTGLRCTLPGVR